MCKKLGFAGAIMIYTSLKAADWQRVLIDDSDELFEKSVRHEWPPVASHMVQLHNLCNNTNFSTSTGVPVLAMHLLHVEHNHTPA